jgi:hypothetical protein
MVAIDMKKTEYKAEHEALAAAWKKRSATLTDEARESAPWINQDGQPRGRYQHCLPPEYAEQNLLPHVRRGARNLFLKLWNPLARGHRRRSRKQLLSSQVQCVNALFPMVREPEGSGQPSGFGRHRRSPGNRAQPLDDVRVHRAQRLLQ